MSVKLTEAYPNAMSVYYFELDWDEVNENKFVDNLPFLANSVKLRIESL